MAQAKRLPSGSWRVRIYIGKDSQGKQIFHSITAATKREAEYEAAQYIASKDRLQSHDYTVAEAVAKVIEAKRDVLSPSTVRSYISIQKHHLDRIGGKYVSQVTSEDLQVLVSELSLTHSPKSVKNIYSFILSAIQIYTDRVFRVVLPQRAPIEYSVPTDSEVKRLIDEAPDELRLAILLAAVGTLRRGEICALKHKDVLRDFSAVYVHSDLVMGPDGFVLKEMPKTAGSVRRVILPKYIIEMIPDGDPEEYIIKMDPNALSYAFTVLRKRLGLSCRFHDLRHYAASILHAIGVPDQYIMERGGWSTDGTLKAVYRNTLSDKSKSFNQRANEYFEEKLRKV
jgi:integrase